MTRGRPRSPLASFAQALPVLVALGGAALAQPKTPQPQPSSSPAKPAQPKDGPNKRGKGPRVLTAPELLKQRTEAAQIYLYTEVELKRLAQDQAKVVKELNAAREKVRSAESQAAGPLRTSAVQSARREARRVSDRLARHRMQRDKLTSQQELNRLRLIEVGSQLASRWLDVAHRTLISSRGTPAGRQRQTRKLTDQALAELKKVESLRALEAPPANPPQVPELDEDAGLDELEWRKDAYQRQLEAFADQLAKLGPKEARRRELVTRLETLKAKKYAVPGLDKTLKREQEALQRVMALRQRIEKHRAYYVKASRAIRERIKKRLRVGRE